MFGDCAAGECASNIAARTDWLPPAGLFAAAAGVFRVNGNATR